MADFNLSAEIALQLAKSSIATLKKEIQGAFSNIAADIDTDKTLNAAQKAAYKKVITLPVKLDFKTANTEIDSIGDKLKSVKIKVELDKAFFKKNFAQKKFQEYVDNLGIKPTLKIGVEFDKDAQKALAQLSLLKKAEQVVRNNALKQQNQAQAKAARVSQNKTNQTIQAIKKQHAFFQTVGPFAYYPISNQLKSSSKEVSDFIDLIKALSSESNNLNKSLKATAAQASFFQNASNSLTDTLSRLGNGNENQAVIDLASRFQGLNGRAKDNLEAAVKTLFREITKIEDQEVRLRRALLSVGKNVDVAAKEFNQLDVARQTVIELFNSFDAVDPSVFTTKLKSATAEATESTNALIRNLTNDASRYKDLINSLNAFKTKIDVTGGSDQSKQVIAQQIKLVETLRSQNLSVRDIKANEAFQINSAVLKDLGYVDITLGRIRNTFASLQRKAQGDLSNTMGGKVTRLRSEADAIRANALAELRSLDASNPNRNEQTQDIRNRAIESINKLINRSEQLTKQYTNLKNIEEGFKARGFTQSVQAVRNLTAEFLRAARNGESLDQIAQRINSSLQKIDVGKGIENKVGNIIRQLDRLKITFGRETDGDFTGILGKIEKLKGDINKRLSDTSKPPLGIDELNRMSTEGIFDIRQGERINKFIENTTHKLRLLGGAQDDLASGAVYDKFAESFQRDAAKIISSGNSITKKFNEIKALADRVFIDAKVDAEGGLLGTIGKAAGLAAKRLGAFLILAQGLYGIQAQISQSISDAVKIDKEFVRLEQVITGGLSGPKLKNAYKDLGDLKAQILDLGRSMGIATTEVAGAAQVLAQAGLQGKNLAKILDVVAKSQLGPSFASANETSEAAIAIMNQFKLTAEQTADALGGVNRLSAQYAVEAGGITEAVRRAGGVFATAGGNIGEFSAAFTVIKEQTREADESIATALRNITQRIQRSSVQKYLRETLGVDLINKETGNFIGFSQAIRAVGEAIKKAGISESSPLFSEIRERLAGTLQAGRITPLLQNYEKLIEYNDKFTEGSESIEEDVVKAFNSIENKLQRAKSAVVELFTELLSNEAVKFLIEGFIQLTVVITNMLKVLNTLPGAILAIGAAFKAVTPFKGVVQGVLSQFSPRKFNFATRNDGGKIPGRGSNKDSVLAYLTKGEYVIKRDSVDKYGVDFLDQINKGILPRNKGGVISAVPSFNNGGLNTGGSGIFKSIVNALAKIISSFIPSGSSAVNDYKSDLEFYQQEFVNQLKRFTDEINDPLLEAADRTALIVDAIPKIQKQKQKSTFGIIGENIQPRSQYAKNTLKQYQIMRDSGATDAELKDFGRRSSNLKPNSVPSTFSSPVSSINTSQGSSKNQLSLRTITNGPNKGTVSKDLFPTATSGLKGFYNNVLKSKLTMGTLIVSLLAMQASVTGVNAELGNLIAAMAAMAAGAATFIAAAKAGQIARFATSNVGKVTGLGNAGKIAKIKNITDLDKRKAAAINLGRSKIASRARDISDLKLRREFVKGRSARLSSAQNLQSLTRDKLSLDSGASARTADIIGKIKGAKPVGPVGIKNVGSLANGGKFFGGLVKNLDAVGIAVGVVTGALSYFGSSLEESGNVALESAKNEEEAIKASRGSRLGRAVSKTATGVGSIAGGALTGAAIGAAFGGVGAIPGAIAGALLGFASLFKKQLGKKFEGILGPVSLFIDSLKESIGKFFTDAYDSIYRFFDKEGFDAEVSAAALTGRQNFTKNRLQKSASKGNISGNKLNDAELSDILSTVQISAGTLKGVGGNVEKIDPAVLEQQKAGLQRVSEIFNALSEGERAKVIDAAKRSGVDMQELFNTMEVSLIDSKARAEIAFEKMSLFFAGLKNTVELSNARLSGVEAGMEAISNTDRSSFAIPNQIFDIIAAGFEPNKLGLTQFSAALGNLETQIQGFDQNLYKALKFQVEGQRATRSLKGAVSSEAIKNIKFDSKGNKTESLASVLSESFNLASGGNKELQSKFDEFITSKIESLGEGFVDNNTAATKINEWLDEFSNMLNDTNVLETAKRFNEINQSFISQYSALMQERFAKEGEIIDLVKSNADKQKTLFEIQNKARGLSGSKLDNAQRSQALRIDEAKLGATLTGTGLAANATPQQLQAALLQSQARSQNAGAIVAQSGLTGASAVSAEAEIRAVEEERQKRIQGGLQYIAGGTEEATFAMQQFEKAAQKAAASSKFLTDTLLGTDDQIIDTYKGIAAFQAIDNAKSPEQAQSLLLNMGEGQRAALNTYLGQNEDARARFESQVGFGSGIGTNSKEAKAASDQVKLQQEANAALAAGITGPLNTLTKSTEDLKSFYTIQFENTRAIVNEANKSAQNLVNQIANLPNVITHEGNINVNLVGANQLTALQEGIRGFVQQQINAALAANNQALKENNQGISVPAAFGQSVANSIVPGAGNLLR